MTAQPLPQRATTDETCAWLADQTGTPWNLARLLEHGLTPYVWLERSDAPAALFADGVNGYAAPVLFIEDTQRLAAGSEDVQIRLTRDSDKIAMRLPEPGIRMPLAALRFFDRDIARLADDIVNPKAPEVVQAVAAQESKKGITKEQVLLAFGAIAKLDLEKALASGVGIFGDDGSRVRKNSRAGKNTHLWNPVTLALGLNEVHRVPLPHLKRAFGAHPFLREWNDDWRESLALLGK